MALCMRYKTNLKPTLLGVQRKYVYLCILGIMSKIKLSIIILFTAVWWLAGETAQAQNFAVSNFRALPNDISA